VIVLGDFNGSPMSYTAKEKQMDLNLARIIYEDLYYLAQEWNQDIEEPSLRRASPILRRLLVEDEGLAVLARMMNRELAIVAPTVTIPRIEGIAFFSVGGGNTKLGSITGQGLFLGNAALNKPCIGAPSPMMLSKFLKQTCLVLSDTRINREEVIKYVSNKIGGAHYDSSRHEAKDLEKKYILMDAVHKGSIRSTAMDKNVVYYELLSTGQYLINSPDIQQLAKEIKKLII
jgi:hypothetical protein